MTARTLVVDSGGTTRQIKRWAVVDAGGITRLLKRAFIVDAGGVSRLIFSAGDVLALLAGGPADDATGYTSGGFGSLTPNTLGDGSTVFELSASVTTPFPLIFFINDYPGTITTNYITSLTINTTVFLPASATFSGGSSGGSASWTWSPGFHFISGDAYTITVVRT